MLKECRVALWEGYDVAMLDLDGVVYVGAEAVPGAPAHLEKAASAGMHLAYVTNNAYRPPSVVAEHLRELGIPAQDSDVVNSAQAAARLLGRLVPAGSPVFVIGGPGLFEALTEQGLEPVQALGEDPVAVVSGFNPELPWRSVMDGAMLVRRGLPWVASNTDLTLPTAHGVAPGHGVLVNAIAEFAGRRPIVAGKPQTPLFDETLLRVGGEHPLVVGDRLDTDIEGAVSAGLDSLLVMTGVTWVEQLAGAAPHLRPSYIGVDLAALGAPQPVPHVDGGWYSLKGWRARVDGAALVIDGDGSADDWWRVVATTAWEHLDTTGTPAGVAALVVPGSVSRKR